MSIGEEDQPIYPEGTAKDEEKILSFQFFMDLHELELKMTKIQFNNNHQDGQETSFMDIATRLSALYTDCIDYFSSISQTVYIYYQAKLKDLNCFFTQRIRRSSCMEKDEEETETIQDLGSISSQTPLEQQLLKIPFDQFLGSNQKSKQVFNQYVIHHLKNQNVKHHFKENMKKRQKIQSKMNQNIQNQIYTVENRIKSRHNNIYKKKISQSFSVPPTTPLPITTQQTLSEETILLGEFNAAALEGEYNSIQELKVLIEGQRKEKEYL